MEILCIKKIEEGYKVIEELNIRDKDCVTAIVNVFELEKTINDLDAKTAYDEEVARKEKEAMKKIIEKTEEVEVEC